MHGLGEEGIDHLAVLLDGDLIPGEIHSLHEQPEIRIVAVVMLGHGVAEPGEVLLVGRFPGVLLLQRRILDRLLGKPAQGEIELHRHWMLRPEGTIVIENGDALLGRYEGRTVFPRHRIDEIDHCLPGWRVVPVFEQ